MNLEGYISDLLKDHNCVIVPDFGGFVANYKSAVIDEARKKIYPPSKSVLFNAHLTNNDGLLGNYVSQKEDLTYSDALDFISERVAVWRNDFKEGKRIEIGELGFLYQENGKIHFEQSRELNLLLQAYGLRSIDFVNFSKAAVQKAVTPKTEVDTSATLSVQQEKKETIAPKEQEKVAPKIISIVDETVEKPKVVKKEPKVEEKEVVQETKEESAVIALDQQEEIEHIQEEVAADEAVVPIKRNRYKVVMKYAAAVAFVPVLFYSYWIPMETDALETSAIQINDFNPLNEQVKSSYEKRDSEFETTEIVQPVSWDEMTENIAASTYSFELTEDFYVPIALDNAPAEVETTYVDTPNVEELTETEVVEIQNGDFHVISGCFSVKQNAENKVSELISAGFTAAILDKSGGLHRVTSGGFSNRDAAKDGLQKLESAGFSGWILKK